MNMSYCRFQNTVSDLKDCKDNIAETLSETEHNARIKLVDLARSIVKSADNGDIPTETED